MSRLKKLLLLVLTVTLLLTSIIIVVGAKTTNSIGDINRDSKISAADARLALRAAVGLEKLTDTQFKSADVNNDSKVTAADARTILRVAVGLEKFDIKEEHTENNDSGKNENNIEFKYLNSNPMSCNVGNNEDVLFYIDVISDKKISNEEIKLYIDNKFVGTLNDDGTNGDLTANDGRYSATFPMYSDERRNANYYVTYKNETVKSNKFLFAKSKTQEEEQMISDFYDDIEKIKDKYRFTSEEMINNETNCLNKAEQCYYEIKDYLDKRFDLSYTWTGNYTGFGITFDCNIPVMVTITDLVMNEEKNSTLRLLNFRTIASRDSLSYKSKIITIQPYCNSSEFKNSRATDQAAQNIVNSYPNYNFSSNLDNQEITVDTMKTLSKYGVIILEGHGGNWNEDGYVISLTENVTIEKNQNQYKDDIDNERVIPNGNHYVVTEKFFNYYYSENDFDNALIYLGTCHGGDDNVFIREILYNKGAEAVITYKNSVIIEYMHEMLPTIFEHLSQGKTIEDAVKKAKIKHGSHDPYIVSDTYNSLGFWNKLWYNLGCIESSNPAEVVLTGNNTSFKLIEYPSTEEITGQIIDKTTKQPISDVTIKCDEAGVKCTTDKNGIFKFKVAIPQKQNTFSFTHSMYKDIKITIAENSYSMIDIVEMSPIMSFITGTVTDSKTGKPISNVTVEVIDNASGSLEPVATATTNTNGKYSLELPYGSYSLSFNHENYEYYGTSLSVSYEAYEENATLSPKNNSGDDNTGDSGETEERTVIDSGNCGADGDNVTWTLYEDGELVISGCGEMKDYFMEWYTPWYNYYDNIFNLKVEKGVTKIGAQAFTHCDLRNVKMADTVTEIGALSFFGCHNLSDVMLSQNLSTIGKQSFSCCDKLVQINIPQAVKTINFAFYGCNSLKNIFVDKSNESFTSIGGVLFDKYQTILIHYPAGKENELYTIPDTVTKIRDSAFYYCENLKSVVIPDSVQELEEDVFDTCNGLINVTIGKNIRSIPHGVFHNCHNIKNVFYTGTLKDWCNINFVSHPFDSHQSGGNLYIGGQLVEDLIIPDKISKINKFAFQRCFSLKTITFSNDVTEIEDYAFRDCNNVKEIIWTVSVKKVGTGVFTKDNYDTRTIYYMGQIDDWCDINFSGGILAYGEADLYINGALVENVILKDATEIKDYCFYAYGHLKDVFISSSVEKIASTAFGENYNLKSINVDEDNNYYSSINDVLFNKEKTDLLIYPENKSDISIYSIPVGVINIRESAFSSNNYIEEVIMSNTVRTISENAFNGCFSLKKINIPDSVTKIEARAFDNCFKLNNITVPSSVESIGEDAFNHLIESRDGYIKIFNPNCSIFESPYTIYYDTIYGYKNSTAQIYAEKYGRTFVALD